MTKQVHILGAGLVGSLLGLNLANRGYRVSIAEKRPDPITHPYTGGRSINLALSHRGIHALKKAGVFEQIEQQLIPMHGRMIHDESGNQKVQLYGKKGQFISSVSRAGLNQTLIEAARQAGVGFHFEQECTSIDFESSTFTTLSQGAYTEVRYDLLFAADGAFSQLRKQMEQEGRSSSEIDTLEHGYKELTMSPTAQGGYSMEPNYLHIWPRRSFMLIALPNPDNTFTCTLFLAQSGKNSFESLQTREHVIRFFDAHFHDVPELIPDFADQILNNPTSSLVTVRTYPWATTNTLLIGDAAHAIVPFYGQGMNAGFEDVRLLMAQLDSGSNWTALLKDFQKSRKADVDAIADLALSNFIEMRDRVADKRFLDQKKLEGLLHSKYPEVWTPLYTLVSFTDTPYSECMAMGKLQQQLMDQIPDLSTPDLLDHARIIADFNESVTTAQKASQ